MKKPVTSIAKALSTTYLAIRSKADAIAAAWELCRKHITMNEFLDHLRSQKKEISRATVYRRIKESQTAPEEQQPRTRKRIHVLDDEGRMIIEGLRQNFNAATAEDRYVQFKQYRKLNPSLPNPSLSTYKRWEADSDIPVPHYKSLRRALREKFGLTVKYDEVPVMEVLHMDDTTLKGVRWQGMKHDEDWAHLVAIMDSGSRDILDREVLFHPPTHVDVLRILKRVLHKNGLCAIVRCDNGSIFAESKAFQESLVRLGIKLLPSKVAVPQQNGKIERLFSTIKHGYLSLLDRWTRKWLHARTGHPASLKCVRELVDAYINYYRNGHVHSAIGAKPHEFFKKNYDPANQAINHDLIDRMVLARDETATLTNSGVKFKGHLYNTPKLAETRGGKGGRAVLIKYAPPARDGELPTSVEVFTSKKHPVFICEAHLKDSLPMVCDERDEFNRETNEILDSKEAYVIRSQEIVADYEAEIQARLLAKQKRIADGKSSQAGSPKRAKTAPPAKPVKSAKPAPRRRATKVSRA